MGFAKYHEDNMDMWEERNRDRWLPSTNALPPQCVKTEYSRDRNTYASVQNSSRAVASTECFKGREGRSYAV